jgi:hypothetical protein
MKKKNRGKRKMRAIGFIIAAALTICSCRGAAAFYAGETREIPDDFAGMVHAGDTLEEEEYRLLDEAGVSWILATFYWSSIEREKDAWDFSFYDQFVDKGKEAGKKIAAVLAYDTSWLHDDNTTHRYIKPTDMHLYLRYVENLARRFKGKVDAWEIWNEPNGIFWHGSKKEFAELTRAAIQKIREIDPDVPVLAGAFLRAPASYIKFLFESGSMDQASGLAFHPYAINPQGAAAVYDKAAKTAALYGFEDKLWITEAGYPTGGWYPTRVSEKTQPAYIVKTMSSLAAKGARVVLWYQLFDPYVRGDERYNLDSEKYFGLYYPDYTPKSGAAAYSLCARLLAGTVYRPDLPERTGLPKTLVSYYCEDKDGGGILIVWSTRKVPLRITLPGSGHLLHDPVSGGQTPVPGELVIDAGDMPFILTWKGGAPDGRAPSVSALGGK